MEQQRLQQEENRPGTETWNALTATEVQTEESDLALIPHAEHVMSLATTLTQEVKAQRKSLIVGLPAYLGGMLVIIGLLSRILDRIDLRQTEIQAAIILLAFLGMIFGLVGAAIKPRRRRRQLADLLAKQEDLRAIGPLIQSLGMEDGRMHQIATEGLIHLLPRLKASDASLLTPGQRAILCHVLNIPAEKPFLSDVGYVFRRPNDNDIQFRVAILQAFEQVGDAKALPTVEKLATGTAKTPGQRRIQEAAQACLPALQLLASQEQSSQTLLRASHSADTSPETLLRAATVTTETAPEQLLRPGRPIL